jgi:hypothetical protein
LGRDVQARISVGGVSDVAVERSIPERSGDWESGTANEVSQPWAADRIRVFVFGNGSFAVRGGFGLFFDSINANVVGISEPYHYTATFAYPSGGYSVPLLEHLNLAASGGAVNQEVLMPAIPQNYVRGATPVFTLPYAVNYADSNLRNPYTETVNFGFQLRVAKGSLLEGNYVGKFGRHGIIPIDQNPSIYNCSGSYYLSNPTLYCPSSESIAETPVSYAVRSLYPGFNYGGQGIVDNESVGTSNYNGLQVIYSQRASKKLNTYMSMPMRGRLISPAMEQRIRRTCRSRTTWGWSMRLRTSTRHTF